jgi:hypothetical protein
MSRYPNLKTFKNQELTRLTKALNQVKKEYLKENYGKLPYEDYRKFCLVTEALIPLLTLMKMINLGLGIFDIDETKKRPKYDLIEGISRGLIGRFLVGKLLSKTLSDLKADSTFIIKTLLNLGFKYKQLLGKTKYVLTEIDKALDINKKAAKIFAHYTDNEEKDVYAEEKALIYTSYKLFKTDKEFESFIENYGVCAVEAFELIIEDGIKIYLKLTKDDFVCIFNGFTIQAPFKLSDNSDAVRMAVEAQSFIRESYVNGTLGSFVDFLKSVVSAYLEDFEDEQYEIRSALHTKIEQENFIEVYENGALFTE